MNRSSSKSQRSAFTLVELLVVIAIIGILMSLTLPAIQSSRESGRRTRCANKIRQLGVAILKYETSFKSLPTSTAYDTTADTPAPPAAGQTGKGWIINVLPHMEEDALYQQFLPGFKGQMGPNGGIQRPECREAMKTQLPGLQCPSDMDAELQAGKQWQWNGQAGFIQLDVGLTNYKGVIGDNRMGGAVSIHPGSMPDCHRTRKCPGVFWRNTYLAPVKIVTVRDGASKTFMLGEDIPEYNRHSAAFYSNGDYASCHAPLNYTPNPPTPDDWPNVMSFRSRHPAGAEFCLVDGSTHFVNDSIDYTIYKGLSTKAGGEDAQLP